MTEKDVLKIFDKYKALLEGHFKLSSGLHSGKYLQCALVLQYPRIAEKLSSGLAQRFSGEKIDVVVGPRPEEVFKKDPRVGNVFIYNKHAALKDKMRFIKRLKAERYDLAIDMKTSLLPV